MRVVAAHLGLWDLAGACGGRRAAGDVRAGSTVRGDGLGLGHCTTKAKVAAVIGRGAKVTDGREHLLGIGLEAGASKTVKPWNGEWIWPA